MNIKLIGLFFIVVIGVLSLKALSITLLTKLFFDGCFVAQGDVKSVTISWLIFGINGLSFAIIFRGAGW